MANDTRQQLADKFQAFLNHEGQIDSRNKGWIDQINNTGGVGGQIDQLSNQFSSLFKNFVGRDPTDGELAQFYQQLAPDVINLGGSQQHDQFRNNTTQFINDTFQQQAKDYATQQLQGQQSQANSLADLFRKQGNQAINDVQGQLLDYQQKLFEKLRPNLITSLSAQGLLDTGGLNQAVAGAQADMANAVTPFLAQQRLANEQQANQIAFGGASAPYQYQQANIMNQVPYLQQMGQGALDQNYNTYLNNLNFQHQYDLLGRQYQLASDAQPSFLRTLGQSTATSLGNSLGQWASPNPGGASGGQSGPAVLKGLF